MGKIKALIVALVVLSLICQIPIASAQDGEEYKYPEYEEQEQDNTGAGGQDEQPPPEGGISLPEEAKVSILILAVLITAGAVLALVFRSKGGEEAELV